MLIFHDSGGLHVKVGQDNKGVETPNCRGQSWQPLHCQIGAADLGYEKM